ncbi:MAG: hypothetical protein AAGD25_36905 [Cyanobacteria bacterium P01_F01_bin.150]
MNKPLSENSELAEERSRLIQAIQEGEHGIEQLIQALDHSDKTIQRLARRLLRSGNKQSQQALVDHQPLSYFTTLGDWNFEPYDHHIGIADPENTAYSVRMTNAGELRRRSGEYCYDLSQFDALVEDPNVTELQALIFRIDYNDWDRENTFKVALDAICEEKGRFQSLKALFVGDSEGDRAPEFRKSKLPVFGIRPFLEAFPSLESLQVFGYFGDYERPTLNCERLEHAHLKSLIIETSDIDLKNLYQLCSMELPNLEYFELWFGRRYNYDTAIFTLQPIFNSQIYPQLKYLGLCSSEEADKLVQSLSNSPLINQLIGLDLKMGALSDDGIVPLLEHAQTSNLRVLSVGHTQLWPGAIESLNQVAKQVIATYRFSLNYPNYYELDDFYADPEEIEKLDPDSIYGHRHWALHE